jgi:hypothetical protein
MCEPEDSLVNYDWKLASLVFMPPYRFVYHHRSQLLAYAKTCKPSIGSQISALLAYVEATCGHRYKQADDLFHQGKTTRPSLEFLFLPGDLLISSTQGSACSAYTLYSWSPLTATGIALDCWGWTFDGLQFRRKHIILTVGGLQRPVHDVVQIHQLPVYPIKYAPQELCNHLKSRGQKFWNLRFQHYVSYSGWDVMKDENHVRYSLILQLHW